MTLRLALQGTHDLGPDQSVRGDANERKSSRRFDRPMIACSVLALMLGACTDMYTNHVQKNSKDVWPPAEAAEDGAQVEGPAAAIVRVADNARARGEYATAINLYRRALAFAPQDPVPLIGLGETLAAIGQPNEAAETFREALDFVPDNSQALRGLANALIQLDQTELAVEKLNVVLAKNPADVRALNSMGVARDKAGQFGEAQKHYRQAMALAPNDESVRGNLGLSLALSGDYDAAIETLSELATGPDATPRHRQNLALAYGLAGQPEKAAEVARRDLAEDDVQQNLGYYEVLRGSGTAINQADAIGVGIGDFTAVDPL